jgi:hypothetical protein
MEAVVDSSRGAPSGRCDAVELHRLSRLGSRLTCVRDRQVTPAHRRNGNAVGLSQPVAVTEPPGPPLHNRQVHRIRKLPTPPSCSDNDPAPYRHAAEDERRKQRLRDVIEDGFQTFKGMNPALAAVTRSERARRASSLNWLAGFPDAGIADGGDSRSGSAARDQHPCAPSSDRRGSIRHFDCLQRRLT